MTTFVFAEAARAGFCCVLCAEVEMTADAREDEDTVLRSPRYFRFFESYRIKKRPLKSHKTQDKQGPAKFYHI
jgi:hypothetical protein